MVFYKDGTPTADAQIVSGNPFVPNCATPVGCYTTGEMKSGCTVNGEDYPSAVNYWIPFDGNLGISDAPWRMDFGGQLYTLTETDSPGPHSQCRKKYPQESPDVLSVVMPYIFLFLM